MYHSKKLLVIILLLLFATETSYGMQQATPSIAELRSCIKDDDIEGLQELDSAIKSMAWYCSSKIQVNDHDYYGAILIALEEGAVESLEYLVNKVEHLSKPLQRKHTLLYYAKKIMAGEYFQSKNLSPSTLAKIQRIMYYNEEIIDYIASSNVEKLIEYDARVQSIAGFMPPMPRLWEHSLVINHAPYYGALVLAAQHHAVNAFAHLAGKEDLFNTAVYQTETFTYFLDYFIIMAMATSSFQDEKKIKQILTILEEKFREEQEDPAASLSPLYSSKLLIDVACCPTSPPFLLEYILKRTDADDAQAIKAAFKILLQTHSDPESVRVFMEHEANYGSAFRYALTNYYQHLETIKQQNPTCMHNLGRQALQSTDLSFLQSTAERNLTDHKDLLIQLSSELGIQKLTNAAIVDDSWVLVVFYLNNHQLTIEDLLAVHNNESVFEKIIDALACFISRVIKNINYGSDGSNTDPRNAFTQLIKSPARKDQIIVAQINHLVYLVESCLQSYPLNTCIDHLSEEKKNDIYEKYESLKNNIDTWQILQYMDEEREDNY